MLLSKRIISVENMEPHPLSVIWSQYYVIFPKTRIAIGNAQKVLESFDGSNPAKEESSTTVHQLVEQLLQFIE